MRLKTAVDSRKVLKVIDASSEYPGQVSGEGGAL